MALVENIYADTIHLQGTLGYDALRAYTGGATSARITGALNAGIFERVDGSTLADNGGTVIVDAAGRRWVRPVDSAVSLGWFLKGVGPDFDAGEAFTRAITAYPYSSITVPYIPEGLYIKTQVVEPQSASFEITGPSTGLQVNHQQLIHVAYNGPAFYCAASNTTFTKYSNLRFQTSAAEFPLAAAVVNDGFWVHGELKNITCKFFRAVPLRFNGYNCCNFEQLLLQFNEGFGITCLAGAANTFDRIVGDNNNGGVMRTTGAGNVYRALYSEDCCKSNVTSGDSNPEFYFEGDAPVVTGLSINSYPNNSVPPVALNFCRNFTLLNCVNKSSVTPSYAYEIGLTNADSSATLINCSSIRIQPGSNAANTIQLDAGYAGTRPSIKVGGFGRDLVKNTPISTAAFAGTDASIFEANGIASIQKVSTGQYRINLAETLAYPAGVRISGSADADGYGNGIIVSEVGSARTATKVEIVTADAGGNRVDPYHVTVQIWGTVA